MGRDQNRPIKAINTIYLSLTTGSGAREKKRRWKSILRIVYPVCDNIYDARQVLIKHGMVTRME